jgi:putative oxidoreductase
MAKRILLPAGGLMVIICFFLPWVRACDVDMSGLQLATEKDMGEPILWLIPIAGTFALVAYFLIKNKAALIGIISSIAGLLILLWKILVPVSKGELQELGASIQIGGIGTILGFILSLIGSTGEDKKDKTPSSLRIPEHPDIVKKNTPLSLSPRHYPLLSSPFVILLARILISLIFIWSGLQKIFHFSTTEQYMAMHKMPATVLFLVAAIIIELGLGLAVFFGFQTRWAALIIAIYLIPVTLIFHGHIADQNQLTQFLKNLTTIGGLLMLIAFDGGKFSLTPPQ